MTAEYFDQIEQFLNDELSRKELEDLLPEVDAKQLEKDISLLRNMRTAVEAAGLRDQLQEALPKVDAEPAKVRSLFSWKRGLSIAASIALLLSIYWFWPGSGEEGGLYAKYEYVDPGLPVLMSQSEDYDLYDALSYYSEEDYETAISKLSSLQAEGVRNDTISFYLGASQLYQGQIESAKTSLGPLSSTINPFQERAEWLLVLVALQEEDLTAVQSLAEAIRKKESHIFNEQAKNLLTDLKAQ